MYEIIVNVDRMEDDVAPTRLGLAIAAQLQAFATGVHIVQQIPAVAAIPEALAIIEAEEESARRCNTWWNGLCASAGVAGAWEVLRGQYVPMLAARSRMGDLMVSPWPYESSELTVGFDVVTRTLFAGGIPMLLVPENFEVTAAPRRILVAWNGSGEATEAIRAALPLLRRAEAVHLLDGWRPTLPGFGPPPLPVAAWLMRQDVTVERQQRFDPGSDAGAALLAEARAMRADLLVMGAWGRPRLSELVLGGTTHHVLAHAQLPLLVAH